MKEKLPWIKSATGFSEGGGTTERLKYCCNSGDFSEIHLLLLRGKTRMLHSLRANQVVF